MRNMLRTKRSMCENTITLPEHLFIREVRQLYYGLRNLIEFRGYEQIILDFSEVQQCFPDAMLPLIAAVIKYRDERVSFSIVPPRMDPLRRTFESANWLHLLAPERFPPVEDRRDGRFSAHIFTDPQSQHLLVNAVMDQILRAATYLDRTHLRALEWALNEITDNVIVHSLSDTGGVLQLSLKPKAKEIQFVASDCGIGIPESLRSGLKTDWTDEWALEEAVKEGVTRGTGQGNGLFGSMQIAATSGGAFSINSGNAYLALTRSGITMIRTEGSAFPGSSIDCTISYARPLVLERALRFGGKVHHPVDMIELQYENDEECIIFRMKDETVSIGSRYAGFDARRKLENIVKMTNARHVVIDCSDVALMASSFADEFIVKFIERSSSLEYQPTIIIAGLTEINVLIIDRSSRQRLNRALRECVTLT